jgi:hypothetical protein
MAGTAGNLVNLRTYFWRDQIHALDSNKVRAELKAKMPHRQMRQIRVNTENAQSEP